MLELHIDKERFNVKPNDSTIVKIANRITEFKWKCSVREFATWVGEEGRAFVPVLMEGERKGSNFKQQQVFSIDFDETLSLDEFWERSKKVEIYPVFVYKTLNCHENNDRFRAVYINNCIVEDAKAASIITKMLLYLFPEGDPNCKDLARLYLGGKGLLYYNEDNRIDAVNISIAVQTYWKSRDSKNYVRKMEEIGRNLKVDVTSGVLRILAECSLDEEFRAEPYRYYIGHAQDSSLFYYYEYKNIVSKTHANKKNVKILRNKKEKEIIQCCPLFEEYYLYDLHHNQKFMLATNMAKIKGGKTLFFKGLKDHCEKWEAAWKDIIKNEYHPMSCQSGKCTYASQCKCNSLYEKLQRRILVKKEQVYISMEQGMGLLNSYIKEAVESWNKDIFLIKAQTSIGKTYTYCELLSKRKETERPVLIAAPTNDLQQQVYKDLKDRGVTVKRTRNLCDTLDKLDMKDLCDECKELYRKGFGKKVKGIVKKQTKDMQLHLGARELLDEAMDSQGIFDGKTHVVTTHAMLIELPIEVLRKYEIIVDEDILLTLFQKMEQISFGDLEQSLESKALIGKNKERIKEILNEEDGKVGFSLMSPMNETSMEIFYEEDIPIYGSLQGFLQSSTYHVDTHNKMITYFVGKNLPNVSMTIVSATIDENLYRDYLKTRRVEVREIPLIKYTGKLIQYTNYSMSRKFIQDAGWNKVKNSVDKIVGNPNMNLITFKTHAGNLPIYFGKTAGFNKYKNQDLCVLGTPHNIPYIYRLIGKHMGYLADEEMNVHKVENESFVYHIMTFGNSKMQNLQLYFLESELEQAVGRARLLRFDCKVYLFSNFPLKQAEIIQDDYLIAEDVK